MKKIIVISITVLVIATLVVLQKFEAINNKPVISSGINSNSSGSETINPNSQTPSSSSTTYKDGSYMGKVTNAIYGDYQVRAMITGGKISDVIFLKYPNDAENSIEINNMAKPILKQEAISSQNANVDIVTGATQTSIAFRESLQSALDQAM